MRNPSGKSAYAKKQRIRAANPNQFPPPENQASSSWQSSPTRAEQYLTPERPVVHKTVMSSGKTIRSIWIGGELKFV